MPDLRRDPATRFALLESEVAVDDGTYGAASLDQAAQVVLLPAGVRLDSALEALIKAESEEVRYRKAIVVTIRLLLRGKVWEALETLEEALVKS